jgi:hypothetical protein
VTPHPSMFVMKLEVASVGGLFHFKYAMSPIGT